MTRSTVTRPLAVLALALIAAGSTGCETSPIVTHADVVRSYESAQYQQAYDGATRLTSTTNGQDEVEAEYLAGLSAYQLGRDWTAIGHLNKVKSNANTSISGPANATIGLAYARLSRHDRAVAAYQTAVTKLTGNEQAQAYYHMAVSEQKLGRWSTARAHLAIAASRATDPGLQQAARAQGFSVLVVSSERDYQLEQQLVDLLIAKDVEGIIINPLFDEKADLSHLFEIKRRNIPMVLIENVRGIQASMVDVDNVAASKEAVKYLIDQGHKRIVHFAGPKYSMHSDERIEGVRRAFSAQRLIFDDHHIVYAGARLEDGYQAGLDFFRDRTEDVPTAITCYNDLLALGLIRALNELGLRVPDDVSVIGYDDIDMASYASVPLTTVRVPKEQIGKQATDILVQHIEALDAGVIEKVCLQAELVVRESTRALLDEEAEEMPDLVTSPSER